jgi:hypothetical protein
MSDIFTKALPRPKFEMCRDKMNLCHKFFWIVGHAIGGVLTNGMTCQYYYVLNI